jgi:hypothetical protein
MNDECYEVMDPSLSLTLKLPCASVSTLLMWRLPEPMWVALMSARCTHMEIARADVGGRICL